MTKPSFLHRSIAVLAATAHLCAPAADIDLFVNGAPASTTDLPNVLFVLDNTANWSSASKGSGKTPSLFEIEKPILVNTFNTLLPTTATGAARFRVGLMLATETGSGDSNVEGGYIRAAIRPMTGDAKGKYRNLIDTLDENADKGNGGVGALQMAEAHRYFSGGAPYAGNNKVKTDYTGNPASTPQWNTSTASRSAAAAVIGLGSNALASKAGAAYTSPVSEGSCAKNFIIYISNGPNQLPANRVAAANNLLQQAGGDTTRIAISPAGSADDPIDEWARFLRKSPASVITYTIDVDPGTTGQGPGWSAVLKSMAATSNGKYFAVSSASGGAEISEALSQILSEIQAVNTVFASVSLPVSVNTEGTYLNQVFIGMFRPDEKGLPRWRGNLKQYRLAMVNGELSMVDADGRSAVNSQSGFIDYCARSYWTPTVADTYWSFSPQGSCRVDDSDDPSNTPDGNIVEKGGQAFVQRLAALRTPVTCSNASCTALAAFSSTTASTAALAATDNTERDAIISWARGADTFDEDIDNDRAETRPSLHGDVVHSRPLAINFAASDSGETSSKVVVVYGGNDGFLRAINGNRDTSLYGVPAGAELWSFVPPEFFTGLTRLYRNEQTISFPGSTVTSPTPAPKSYAMDGPLTSYQSGGSTWVFAPMRRGGRAIYAFDMSGFASANTAPALKWKGGCGTGGCAEGYSNIGETWSAAKPIRTLGYTTGGGSPTPKPMLIMGGGYDAACEDADPYTCASPTYGNRIYVIDADTGAVLKEFTTLRPVVGDVFTVPDGQTGRVKWAYAADLGGNLYRISGAGANSPFADTAPGSWTITRIAALGGTGASARKFFFSPDVIEEEGGEYQLLIGSGDREKPLRAYTGAFGVQNYFFMVKDRPTDSGWLSTGTDGCGGVVCLTSLQLIASDATPPDAALATKKGWALQMRSGEQVVTSGITVFGYTTFSSQIPAAPPAAGVCSSGLGEAYVYNVAYNNAAPMGANTKRYEDIAGDGLPPSPVAGQVKIDGIAQPQPFIIGSSGSSPLESRKAPPRSAITQPKGRAYWQLR